MKRAYFLYGVFGLGLLMYVSSLFARYLTDTEASLVKHHWDTHSTKGLEDVSY